MLAILVMTDSYVLQRPAEYLFGTSMMLFGSGTTSEGSSPCRTPPKPKRPAALLFYSCSISSLPLVDCLNCTYISRRCPLASPALPCNRRSALCSAFPPTSRCLILPVCLACHKSDSLNTPICVFGPPSFPKKNSGALTALHLIASASTSIRDTCA